jgi:D-alanyl-lipoteichoic acid acyltransferase DltB (MBOAT superfamily)
LVNHWASLAWLTGASLFFYGWWDPRYLWLIGASIFFNFLAGRTLIGIEARSRWRKPMLGFALAVNLMAIAYFKYANFFVENVNGVLHHPLEIQHIVLPLGISFFTFTQIAFLVDCYRHQADEPNALKYTLFVTYFPHLIAGPIIRHNDLIPQFHRQRGDDERAADMATGATLFTIGLAKKTLIADNLAPYSDIVFAAAAHGPVGTSDAWLGTLLFVFQVYFDFSAYSDMALGSSLLFGIRLPLNFNSPYKAASIVEFWRRWHVTLQKFIFDYLYTPLAVALTRKSIGLGLDRWSGFLLSGALPLLFVFMLIGLWHGAGWNFAVFGLMHGVYITINEAWRLWRKKKKKAAPSRVGHVAAVSLTFAAVVVSDVVFRAGTLSAVLSIYKGMLGMSHTANLITFSFLAVTALTILGLLTWAAPNSMEITWRMHPALEPAPNAIPVRDAGRFAWMPSRKSAMVFGLACIAGLLALSNLSPFIYFQF